MQHGWLPLFPLQVVLLPGAQLPLHIFEDRYKEMIGEALTDKTEFGVILANPQGIAETGCTASIEAVLKRYPDGRMDILTRGKRRFEVLLVNQERNFLRGSVEFFEDDAAAEAAEGGSAGDPSGVDQNFEKARAMAIASYNIVQASRSGTPMNPADPDPQLSFRLAHPVEDLVVRQSLLMSRSEEERLVRLAEVLPLLAGPGSPAEQQAQIQKVRDAARTNGHGHYKIEDN